jgi:hypothetical protein
MTLRLVLFVPCLLAWVAGTASAQSACVRAVGDIVMVAVPGGGGAVERPRSEIRVRAAQMRRDRDAARVAADRRHLSCILAELLKRLGDPEADGAYQAAVESGECEAEHRLLYGDYLRNYRGPGQPLIDQAASQYYTGLACADTSVRNQIRRSLLALYERDGVSLTTSLAEVRPWLFFSTQNAGARSPDDLGAVDTLRTLTSAALLSQQRLRRPLRSDEFAALVRNSWRGRTANRVRLRRGAFALDGSVEGQQTVGSQVLDFSKPTSEADVAVRLGGVGAEGVFDLYPAFDLSVRADAQWGLRTGLVETLPFGQEALRSVTVRAVASRFVGPDKINLEFVSSRADIAQRVEQPIERRDDIVGVTARYQIYRSLGGSRPYERPIASRGSEVFGGVASRTDQYGTLDVIRRDRFAGVAFKGFPGGGTRSFDVTYQRTWFSSELSANLAGAPDVPPFENGQHEDYFTVLYRLVDRENERSIDLLPPLIFLNVVGIASFGTPTIGPTAFERKRYGGQLDAKLASHARGGITWLLSGRYEFQEYGEIALREHLVAATVNLGF